MREVLDQIEKPNGLYPNYLNPRSGVWGSRMCFNLCSYQVFFLIASCNCQWQPFNPGMSLSSLNYNLITLANDAKVLAVINATYAVAKRKPEKIRLAGIRTLTLHKLR